MVLMVLQVNRDLRYEKSTEVANNIKSRMEFKYIGFIHTAECNDQSPSVDLR